MVLFGVRYVVCSSDGMVTMDLDAGIKRTLFTRHVMGSWMDTACYCLWLHYLYCTWNPVGVDISFATVALHRVDDVSQEIMIAMDQ